jgi:hypothetical protein
VLGEALDERLEKRRLADLRESWCAFNNGESVDVTFRQGKSASFVPLHREDTECTYSGRSNERNDDGRRFLLWRPVDERDMEPSLVLLGLAPTLDIGLTT